MKNRIYKHIDGARVDAQFSCCSDYRYTLTVDLPRSDGRKTVCAIMQNPSYACKEYADKSVQFLERFIFEKGYERFSEVRRLIIVNQFAFIKTNDFKGRKEHIGSENDQIIQESLNQSEIGLIAWGKTNSYEDRKIKILEMIFEVFSGFSLQNKEASRIWILCRRLHR